MCSSGTTAETEASATTVTETEETATEETTTADPDAEKKADAYEQAIGYLDAGDYESAYALFNSEDLSGYDDTDEYLGRFETLELVTGKTIIDTDNADTYTEEISYNSDFLPVSFTWEDGTGYSAYLSHHVYYTGLPADFPYLIYIGDFLSGYSCYCSGSITCSYEENGNLTEIKAPEFSLAFTYDEDGRLMSENASNSEVTYIYEYQYNEEGQISEALLNGETAKTYIYDENGLIIKVEYAPVSMGEGYYYNCSEEFSYSDDGELTSAQYDEWTDGEVSDYYKVSASYDENGNVTERVQTYGFTGSSEASEKDSYVYEYDESGNPVSCTLTVADAAGGESVCSYTCQYETEKVLTYNE